MQATEPFFEAVKAGDARVVADFLDQDPGLLQARSQDGVSAVLMAIYYNRPQVAELLIERGAPLDLFEAAATGQLERVQSLVEAQPEEVNAYAPDGFQPLGLAAFFGHQDVAFYLLERGVEVDSASRNPQHVRPLHSAVAGGHLEIARALVGRGADVNATQQGGFTPLHGAAQNGQIEMVQLLLDHGADPQARAADGRSALDFAREGEHAEVVARLEAHSEH
jgi:ankyrin repeat protein